MKSKAKSVQRVIRWYAISAIVLTGFVIAIVVMLPLQARLFDMQKQHLVFTRDVSVLVVDSCFQRVEEIVNQISTRMNGRHLMAEYDQGKISTSQVQAALTDVLKNSLEVHNDLVAIDRFDKNGNQLISVGAKIISPNVMKNKLKKNTPIFEPFIFDQKNYLMVSSPVVNEANVTVGYDIFTFELNKLQTLIDEKLHTKLGKIFIYYVTNNELHWLSLNKSSSSLNPTFLQNSNVSHLLIQSIKNNKSGMVSEKFQHDGVLITYAPIPNVPWGVMVVADNVDLYHAVQHVILILSFIVVLILLFFGLGLAAVLRPLSGRLLMENQELEALVAKGQEKLKTLNEKLYQMAMIDSLTNTLTRRSFYERFEKEVSRSKRYERAFTLLFIDIDYFKLINDTMGHDAGDFLLKTLSDRITKLIRKEDIFARLGGDEFALLLPEKSDSAVIAEIISRVKNCVEAPMEFKQNQFSIKVSIGSAIYPSDGESIDDLLKVADQRMYEDKRKDKK